MASSAAYAALIAQQLQAYQLPATNPLQPDPAAPPLPHPQPYPAPATVPADGVASSATLPYGNDTAANIRAHYNIPLSAAAGGPASSATSVPSIPPAISCGFGQSQQQGSVNFPGSHVSTRAPWPPTQAPTASVPYSESTTDHMKTAQSPVKRENAPSASATAFSFSKWMEKKMAQQFENMSLQKADEEVVETGTDALDTVAAAAQHHDQTPIAPTPTLAPTSQHHDQAPTADMPCFSTAKREMEQLLQKLIDEGKITTDKQALKLAKEQKETHVGESAAPTAPPVSNSIVGMSEEQIEQRALEIVEKMDKKLREDPHLDVTSAIADIMQETEQQQQQQQQSAINFNVSPPGGWLFAKPDEKDITTAPQPKDQVVAVEKAGDEQSSGGLKEDQETVRTNNIPVKSRTSRKQGFDSSTLMDLFQHVCQDRVRNELFTTTKERSFRGQIPLIPTDCGTELEATENFRAVFESRYIQTGFEFLVPPFFTGSLYDAVKEAFESTTGKNRPLALYINNDRSIATNIFPTSVMSNDEVLEQLRTNFVLWPWDITAGENKEKLDLSLGLRSLFDVINAINTYEIDRFPLLILITNAPKGLKLMDVVDASNSSEIAVRKLRMAVADMVATARAAERAEVAAKLSASCCSHTEMSELSRVMASLRKESLKPAPKITEGPEPEPGSSECRRLELERKKAKLAEMRKTKKRLEDEKRRELLGTQMSIEQLQDIIAECGIERQPQINKQLSAQCRSHTELSELSRAMASLHEESLKPISPRMESPEREPDMAMCRRLELERKKAKLAEMRNNKLGNWCATDKQLLEEEIKKMPLAKQQLMQELSTITIRGYLPDARYECEIKGLTQSKGQSEDQKKTTLTREEMDEMLAECGVPPIMNLDLTPKLDSPPQKLELSPTNNTSVAPRDFFSRISNISYKKIFKKKQKQKKSTTVEGEDEGRTSTNSTPELDEGTMNEDQKRFNRSIVIFGIPVVGVDSFEKQREILDLIFKLVNMRNAYYIPTDEAGATKGFCFVEWPDQEIAKYACTVLDGVKVDESHTFETHEIWQASDEGSELVFTGGRTLQGADYDDYRQFIAGETLDRVNIEAGTVMDQQRIFTEIMRFTDPACVTAIFERIPMALNWQVQAAMTKLYKDFEKHEQEIEAKKTMETPRSATPERYSSTIFCSGLPVTTADRCVILRSLLKTVFDDFLPPSYRLDLPTNKAGGSMGVCFVELPDVETAKHACHVLHGYKLDKIHSFKIKLLTECIYGVRASKLHGVFADYKKYITDVVNEENKEKEQRDGISVVMEKRKGDVNEDEEEEENVEQEDLHDEESDEDEEDEEETSNALDDDETEEEEDDREEKTDDEDDELNVVDEYDESEDDEQQEDEQTEEAIEEHNEAEGMNAEDKESQGIIGDLPMSEAVRDKLNGMDEEEKEKDDEKDSEDSFDMNKSDDESKAVTDSSDDDMVILT